MFGFDFIQDADFAGLAVRILVDAEIFFGHFVDVLSGAFFRNFDDTAADFEIAVGVFRINDCERNAWIAPDIFVFLAPPGGVEDDVIAIEVDQTGVT